MGKGPRAVSFLGRLSLSKRVLYQRFHCTCDGDAVEFLCHSDYDWAGDLDDCKSTSGYIFMLNGTGISWKSKKTDFNGVVNS